MVPCSPYNISYLLQSITQYQRYSSVLFYRSYIIHLLSFSEQPSLHILQERTSAKQEHILSFENGIKRRLIYYFLGLGVLRHRQNTDTLYNSQNICSDSQYLFKRHRIHLNKLNASCNDAKSIDVGVDESLDSLHKFLATDFVIIVGVVDCEILVEFLLVDRHGLVDLVKDFLEDLLELLHVEVARVIGIVGVEKLAGHFHDLISTRHRKQSYKLIITYFFVNIVELQKLFENNETFIVGSLNFLIKVDGQLSVQYLHIHSKVYENIGVWNKIKMEDLSQKDRQLSLYYSFYSHFTNKYLTIFNFIDAFLAYISNNILFRISMSLQTKSNQFLYNVIELTHRKKYTRVIRICEYLESQGILSHEFVIVKSYALAHAKGYSEALRYLQPFEGLLINAAKIQYQQMQDMYLESAPLFDSLTTAQGSSILEQLRDNNQILAGNGKESIQQIMERGEENRCGRFVINKKEEEIVAKINQISEDYEKQKKLFQEGHISKNEFNQSCQQFVCKYKQIESHYRVKGKIKELIEQYIIFLTNTIEGTL